jgi:hypothetical protein
MSFSNVEYSAATDDGDPGYETAAWPTYEIYGVSVASDFTFSTPMAAASREPELLLKVVVLDGSGLGDGPVEGALSIGDEVNGAWFHRLADRDLVGLSGIFEFHLFEDRIVCYVADVNHVESAEIALLGTVLSYWLERRKILAIHSAAVEIDGVAAAFIAANTGGKSTLATAFVQRGRGLITDDILPIREEEGFIVNGSYPQLRLWPEQAERLSFDWERLPRAHAAYDKRRVSVGRDGFGRFAQGPLPLGCIYFPARRLPAEDDRVAIEPIAPVQAVRELVQASFAGRLLQMGGLQADRLQMLARLVKRVPVRRVSYPEGLEHLDRVCEAIAADVVSVRRS